ncbi:intradiol ring-cleavage dioxygenase [Herbaspirillum seropedicae]|nr:intradiol ring-cleavage dioxygenase [Herbaspirillum seropedicae]AKN68318.1 hydroxyquinol 1,2-dioxygenase [Herbaspirillum seropedicae]AON56098.1 6-chlorohydroxyquinol-1,2-dioxygenase [Herbaspirillum seropedicae]NQE30389.1 hydroxyquinol 1,2-dioxygenase [Herbaspirillum seropedicae]UMU24326.1 intradiol ring-cleavage dioxygenase [Herbaspirillum seropedicae]
MLNLNEDTITQAVLSRHAWLTDQRLREIMTSLVQHLHAFAREVKLTEKEWFAGIDFLTETGQICSDQRQEFILLSDTLGLSTLVMAQQNHKPAGCTEATVFGPFHVEDAPQYPLGADIANGAKGEPCFVSGSVRGRNGRPLAHARMEVWQADENGFYDVQYADLDQYRARGTLFTDAEGRYHFRSILANPYPIPHDGPVGRMLEKLGRHPWRPAHLHFRIQAEGYETLITHVFRRDDVYLDSDAVFGVRSTLIADWPCHPAGTAPDGTQCEQPFYTLDYDFVLNPLRK